MLTPPRDHTGMCPCGAPLIRLEIPLEAPAGILAARSQRSARVQKLSRKVIICAKRHRWSVLAVMHSGAGDSFKLGRQLT